MIFPGPFLILLSACGYATVALFGKWIFLENLSMYTVLSWRFGGAALVLWLWTRLRGGHQLHSSQKWRCLLLGIVGDALQTTFFFFSVARVGASLAALLLYTFPFFVFMIQRLFFQRSATPIQWLGLILSLTGALFVINPFHPTIASPEYWSGIGFGFATAITYACYISFGSYFTQEISAVSASTYLTLGAFISFASLAGFQGVLMLPSAPSEWSLALLIILIATLIPLLCLVRGLQLLGPTQTSLLFTVEPVITIFFAFLFFGELLTLPKIIGSALILGSSLLIQMHPIQKRETSGKLNSPLNGE